MSFQRSLKSKKPWLAYCLPSTLVRTSTWSWTSPCSASHERIAARLDAEGRTTLDLAQVDRHHGPVALVPQDAVPVGDAAGVGRADDAVGEDLAAAVVRRPYCSREGTRATYGLPSARFLP